MSVLQLEFRQRDRFQSEKNEKNISNNHKAV